LLFPGNAKIVFPLPNTYDIHRATKGGWPLKISVLEDGDVREVALALEKKPPNDLLNLSRTLRAPTPMRGIVTQIDGTDVSQVDDSKQLAHLLSRATSFSVFSQPAFGAGRNIPVRRGKVTESNLAWGTTNPVIGTVELVGSTRRELALRNIRFTLYNTLGLRTSIAQNRRGSLVIRNLHPHDVVRIRHLAKGAVTGILIRFLRATTIEKMFPRGQASRQFEGKLLGRVVGEDPSEMTTLHARASSAVAKRKTIRVASISGHKIGVLHSTKIIEEGTSIGTAPRRTVVAAPVLNHVANAPVAGYQIGILRSTGVAATRRGSQRKVHVAGTSVSTARKVRRKPEGYEIGVLPTER
jgi:hypothetical protein